MKSRLSLNTGGKTFTWLTTLTLLLLQYNVSAAADCPHATPQNREIPDGSTTPSSSPIFQLKKHLTPQQLYQAQDITLQDAAYHRSHGRFQVEWWYFEGIFDNGYSIIVGAMIFSKNHRGSCVLGLCVYYNGEPKLRLTKQVSMEEFEASENYPFIKVSGEQFIKLDRERYNDTGKWVYNVSLELDDQAVYLRFQGTTKGFKGKILRGWYGPPLPKATVNGTLMLDGETIKVTGLGYHEHAWDITLPVWEYGWYWGKTVSNSFTVFWAKMMQTRWREQQLVAVLSKDQSGYIQINPGNIEFKATKYVINCWKLIPTEFMLKITDTVNSIYVDVTMKTISIHHVWGKINHYWRYHVEVNGQITYGSSTETIKDEVQIMELVRFPSLIPIW